MESRVEADFVNTEILIVLSIRVSKTPRKIKFADYSVFHTKFLKHNYSQNMSWFDESLHYCLRLVKYHQRIQRKDVRQFGVTLKSVFFQLNTTNIYRYIIYNDVNIMIISSPFKVID